jgi:capsular exopolysaccharide synthesis family protein
MNPLSPVPDPRDGQPDARAIRPQAANVPPPPIVNAPPTGLALLKALKRRWLRAAVAASLAAIVVGIITWLVVPPPKYVARATLLLNPSPPNPLLRSNAGGETNLDNFRQLQITLIKSQRILLATLRDPNLSQLQTIQEAENPLGWLEQSLSFSAPGNAEVLQVMLHGEHPEELRLLLNSVVKTYLAEFVTSEQDLRNARLAGLRKFKDQYQDELSRARAQRKEYFDAGAANPNQVALQMAFLQADLQRRQGELGKLESEVAELEAQQKQMQSRDPSRLPLDNEIFREFFVQDPEFQRLEADRRDAKDKLTDAKLKGFRDIVTSKLQEKLDAIDKQVLARKQELRAPAEEYWKQRSASDFARRSVLIADALELKRSLADKYQKDLNRTKLMLENLTRSQNKLDDLTFDNQALTEILKQVEIEYNRVRMGINDPPRARELEEARVLLDDSKYRQLKLAVLAGGFAGVLVLFGLAYWEFHARRVESVDQIVYGLGLPLVGTVPAMPRQRLLGLAGGLKDKDLEAWRFALQEAVATTRTMLLNAARTTNMRMVMITSAMPGEGKTSLSTQLAASLAMAGQRTLLLDFDMRNPSAHHFLNLKNSPGWAEILRGEVKLAQAIQKTDIDNLAFIPGGDCDPAALRSLVNEELGQMLNALRTQYDFIIVDTSPVLPVADALLLGRYMDGVIFSVLNEVSQIPKIYVATQRVAQLGIRTLGAVVNGVREDKYGYGRYGYKYRQAGQAKPPATGAS